MTFLTLSTCLCMGFISALFPSGARTKYLERNTYPYQACYVPHPYYHLGRGWLPQNATVFVSYLLR